MPCRMSGFFLPYDQANIWPIVGVRYSQLAPNASKWLQITLNGSK